jgi:putative sterol carrier protein
VTFSAAAPVDSMTAGATSRLSPESFRRRLILSSRLVRSRFLRPSDGCALQPRGARLSTSHKPAPRQPTNVHAMSYFKDAEEAYRYLGGVFRAADEHPEVGQALRASGITLRLEYTNPSATLTVRMVEPHIEVIEGETDIQPDVRLSMAADTANRYWRGEYNVAVGLAKGQVKAKGPVTTILKMVPLTKPLFPMYKEMCAEKDAAPVG